MEEAPAMVFLLSEAWCKSERCEEELMWFVLQRTGADLSNADPADFAKEIFQQPKAALRALRAGAFFVICDEYTENSDVLKTLTESNLAIPREQFFREHKHSLIACFVQAAPIFLLDCASVSLCDHFIACFV